MLDQLTTEERELFSNRPTQIGGGLENQDRLFEICPPQFKDLKNPWVEYVETSSTRGAISFEDFRFKSSDETVCDEQQLRYIALYGRSKSEEVGTRIRLTGQEWEKRRAITAWLLSVILKDIPRHRASAV
jgi:hypothetical protein